MNQKGSAKIILVIIVVLLLGIAGYVVMVKTPGNTLPPDSTEQKEMSYAEFKNLTDWKEGTLADWHTFNLDKRHLSKYGAGKITHLSKSFNEEVLSGNVDQKLSETRASQKALEDKVKETLNNNGWKLIEEPMERGFYQDYLYLKDNHPLLLQIGTRDAIKGGMYVAIEYKK